MPADDECVRWGAIGLQGRNRGVGRALRQERDMERRGIVAAVLREERVLRGDDCEVAGRADDDADLERERVLDRGSDGRRRSALRLSGAKEDVATLQDRGDVAEAARNQNLSQLGHRQSILARHVDGAKQCHVGRHAGFCFRQLVRS